MKKIAAIATTALTTATLLSGTVHTAQAASGPTWNENVHCKATDPEGRHNNKCPAWMNK